MLEVRNLSVSYGLHGALDQVSIQVSPGEIVVILGANGAGKSTLLGTIAGINKGPHGGDVVMDGHPILGLPAHRIVERGIALVPESRGVFGDLTVRENLLLGAYSRHAREDQEANLDRILTLFPKLAERNGQIVRTMSGGEQQMVAIGRAMMSAPTILMLDEPSLGLSPLLCKELFHNLAEVRRAGLGILLVEQNAKQSLAIADRGYLLENAHITHEDTAGNLMNDPAVQKAYLGAVGVQAAAMSTAAVSGSSEIAAAAMASVEAPPRFTVRRRVAPSLRAEDLIGESIDDLVRRAERAQAPRPTISLGRPTALSARAVVAAPVTAPAVSSSKGSGSRLNAVLAEIEQAAVNARHRKPRTAASTAAEK